MGCEKTTYASAGVAVILEGIETSVEAVAGACCQRVGAVGRVVYGERA